MTDNSFYMLVDIFVAGCGIYVIAQYLYMVRNRKLRQNMMLPKDLSIEKCKDVEGYIKAVGTKLLLFGIAATICGCISLVQDFAGFYNFYVSMGSMVVFIALCVWYGRESKKAIEKFWK